MFSHKKTGSRALRLPECSHVISSDLTLSSRAQSRDLYLSFGVESVVQVLVKSQPPSATAWS